MHSRPTHRRPSRGLPWLALSLAVVAAPLHAVSEADRARGLRLAREGRCPAALEALAGSDATDAEAWIVIGTCRSRLGRHPEALEAFARARLADPDLPGLDLRTGVARFHVGDLAGADAALDDAAPAGESGELRLYRGLVALARGAVGEEAAAAAADLERARALDPGVEPVASYHAGLAHRRAGDDEAARAAFERVLAGWPRTAWAARAERALAEALRPAWWARLEAGFEYDDNVVLRGAGVTLPEEISSERDVRGVYTLDVGGELFARGPWSLGGRVAWTGRVHRELSDFDTQLPAASLWLDRGLGASSRVRLQVLAGYAWVGGAPYAVVQRLLGTWLRDFGRFGTTSLGGEVQLGRFFFRSDDVPDGPGAVGARCREPAQVLCGPVGLDERDARDRSGVGLLARAEHTWPLSDRASLTAGYVFEHFDADGREYGFTAHGLRGAVRVRLPARLALRVEGRFTYRPYERPSTFPDPDAVVGGRQYGLDDRRRRETTWRTHVALERAFGEHVKLAAHWTWVRNASSSPVFDYRSQVVGGRVTLAWGGR